MTSNEGQSSSQKRPWRKARTLASKASPGMSRGGPSRRPPKGFLEEEGLGGLGGGVLVFILSDAGGMSRFVSVDIQSNGHSGSNSSISNSDSSIK